VINMTEDSAKNENSGGQRAHGGHLVAARVAIISLLVCGVIFPLVVTGVAQVLLPYQANGEPVSAGGRIVGSNLIAQPFTGPIFFHPRNDSASGVDPDITLQDALAQVPRIHSATGIPVSSLDDLIQRNVVAISWISGEPYVNVLNLNLQLIRDFPSVYAGYP